MRNRDDWVELELKKQEQRLKYIHATTRRNVICEQPPRRIFIEPTNACNLNCIHCVHDGKMKRPLGMMELDLYKKIMSEIKHLNRVSEICLFQQGEPLLHKNISEMIHIASYDCDFFTKMNTNGLALDKEMSEMLIRNDLDYLVFSLDGILPETYRIIKRKDVFNKVLENILNYLELWGELDIGRPRNYFACDVIMLEFKFNKKQIAPIKTLFEKLPVGHVEVYELFNYMGAVEEANFKYPERFTTPIDKWPICNTAWDVVGIRWNGDVVPCIYDYDSRFVIGNVKEQNLLDIWNGEAMKEFRQALIKHDYSKIEKNGPLCSNCTIMWMKDYQLPSNFYSEVKRMESYLMRAIDRVARRHERTEILLQKHKYLKQHRHEWLCELEKAQEELRKELRQNENEKEIK